jgi:hypothetical protein
MYQRELDIRQKELAFQELSKKRAAAAKKQMLNQQASKVSVEQQKLDRYKKAMDCKRYKEDIPQKKQPIVVIDDTNLDSTPMDPTPEAKVVDKSEERPKSGRKASRGRSIGKKNLDSSYGSQRSDSESESEEETNIVFKNNSSLMQANERYCGIRMMVKGSNIICK